MFIKSSFPHFDACHRIEIGNFRCVDLLKNTIEMQGFPMICLSGNYD
ncbi:MAG: hypothetical protein L0Y79_03785 [Chlorobi bacterium]|nr:hypothetical protein [Chlorobiota bacterium]